MAVADEGCGRGAGVIHSRIVLPRVVRGDGRAAGRRRRVEGGAPAASRRFVARGVVPASSAGILGEALFRFMNPERSDRFETIGSVPLLFPMLLLGLREVLDEVLGVDSGTAACSYKVVVVLA